MDADTAGDSASQTVNPSLLDKYADSYNAPPKTERRDQGSMDVLQRARQMNMKIWALEKLQRMITTINDNDIGGQNDTARNKTTSTQANTGRDNDLSRVLRQEQMNGPSDRDPLSSMEMLLFKGPFIYIHDMNEKTKPVMVREYSRVSRRQDGAWPQFRSAPLGKCPFIDEPPTRKDYDRPKTRDTSKAKKEAKPAVEDRKVLESVTAAPTAPLAEKVDNTNPNEDLLNEYKRPEKRPLSGRSEDQTKPLRGEGHERKSSESFIPPPFPRTGPFYTGREPAASGVQPSNVTSAIRSQMISSTAAAPGAKAGLSKEVHGLKRKVLEKGTGVIAPGSMAAPQRPSSTSATQPPKAEQNHVTKSSATEKTGDGLEDRSNQSEGAPAGTKRRRDEPQEQPKKTERRRDPKPGYCENCRDKFDDFEEVSALFHSAIIHELELTFNIAYFDKETSPFCTEHGKLDRT